MLEGKEPNFNRYLALTAIQSATLTVRYRTFTFVFSTVCIFLAASKRIPQFAAGSIGSQGLVRAGGVFNQQLWVGLLSLENHDLIMNLPSPIRLASLSEDAVERQIVIGRVWRRPGGKNSTV